MTDSIHDLPARIKSIYSTCSEQEQVYLKQILIELSQTGSSRTYENIWLSDFKEVPVSIDQFISDPEYLGKTNRNGEAVYPFWKSTLRNIFNAGNKYNEIILSGATRIGKTSTANVIAAYMLYRLMLYRNPHEYFKKKEVSRFSIVFANLTKDLAFGVAYREFNDTLKESPWFNDHGSFSRSERNFYYVPEGDKIEIIAVSDSAQALGKQCLIGSTKILTPDGYKFIDECAGTNQTIYQLCDGELVETDADIACTKYVEETIRIELEDGSIVEGTSDHKIMLLDGSYKELQELTSSDDILTLSEAGRANVRCVKIKSVHHIHYDNPIPVYDVVNVEPNHNFAILSNSIIISHNCWFALMDETNFAKAGVKDINKAKQHMKALYDTINARISGTFRIGGEVHGKLVASSSKNTDSDFLSNHIESQLNSGNSHLYLVDEPQWKILPKEMFSDKKFYFTVGDRYKRGFVIPEENEDEAHFQEYESQGYRIVEAPAELRKNFLADYDISLRDIAGISVTGAMGFITQDVITPCISLSRKNPFYTDTIQIGTQDNASIEEFFHIEAVPAELKHCFLSIHLDLAEVSDRQGIVGTCVDGTKIVTDATGRNISMPFYRQLFAVGIEAPRGDRMSYQKVVNFLIWLRRSGFNIGIVSTDQFQSSYVRETLSQQGFNTAKISVDRSEDPYIGLKNILYDQRIELIKNQVQEDELINLQRIGNRIDHPTNGTKDISDALCGSVWNLVAQQIAPTPSAKAVSSVISAVNGSRTNHRNNGNQIAGFNYPFSNSTSRYRR